MSRTTTASGALGLMMGRVRPTSPELGGWKRSLKSLFQGTWSIPRQMLAPTSPPRIVAPAGLVFPILSISDRFSCAKLMILLGVEGRFPVVIGSSDDHLGALLTAETRWPLDSHRLRRLEVFVVEAVAGPLQVGAQTHPQT